MNEYVLDTSALLAYIEDEEGSIQVETLLNRALDDEIALYISVISSIEVFYISWQEQGEEVEDEVKQLKLPYKQISKSKPPKAKQKPTT